MKIVIRAVRRAVSNKRATTPILEKNTTDIEEFEDILPEKSTRSSTMRSWLDGTLESYDNVVSKVREYARR